MHLQTLSLLEVMGTRWRELSAREASYQVLVVRTMDSDNDGGSKQASEGHP